jgi:hypothetical protein
MCVARLSAAYADIGEVERACAAAEEVIPLAQGLGSQRVAGQITLVHRSLVKWQHDPAVASVLASLKLLVNSFNLEREAS